MKPPMQEELEDDLAAEEENKLINEVYQPYLLDLLNHDTHNGQPEGIQNLVRPFCIVLSIDPGLMPSPQEEERAILVRCCHHPCS